MSYISHLKCLLCGQKYQESEVEYVCPKHQDEGRLDVIYDYQKIKESWSKEQLRETKKRTIWRYNPLLPIDLKTFLPDLPVGPTPLFRARQLGLFLGLDNVFLKYEGANPTASLKDRASIIAVVKAIEKGKRVICVASSGNAAASLAGLAANAGLEAVVFVPKTTPEPKLAQMKAYGALIVLVDGSYDDAFDLCLKAGERFGWYQRNTGYNPYLSEGKKTALLEIAEQFNWRMPDKIFTAVGDGCILGSLGKGIRDLAALGWIDRKPELIGVQAQGAAALFNAWQKQTEVIKPVQPATIAESIAVGLPRDGLKALRAVKETNGQFVVVSDEELIGAVGIMARFSGIFTEPAGAAGLAALVKMKKQAKIRKNETIVILVTADGLKDTKSISKLKVKNLLVKPNLSSLEEALSKINFFNYAGI